MNTPTPSPSQSPSPSQLPLQLTYRKIITDNNNVIIGYRLENKQKEI